MSWQQVGTEAQHFPPYLNTRGEGPEEAEMFLDDGGEEDGIDLEGYEEYLEHLKSKAAIRPCSARVVRRSPTESPQFLMANGGTRVPQRPARPVSARPRLRTTPRNSPDDGSQFRSSGVGVRRKRQGEKLVHARIRAVYNDVGRSSPPTKQPYSATPALKSKFKGLQGAEMHDEYYRLLDSESELKATCLREQQRRVKAVAHARRLEEIIAMKDKKIESLLHAKAIGADTGRSAVQRENAERDRQIHALTQKLRQTIAQQSQVLSSYEEAMQSLRSGMKNTNLMELEEERSQLYLELRHHQELLDRQRLEWEAHQQKQVAFGEADTTNKIQIGKLQQENKIIALEKRKLQQEVEFLRSHVEVLQSNLALEQRKRTYDREFSDGVGKHTYVSSPPTQKIMLAQALEEMKKLMRKEAVVSTKREKLKSPKAGAIRSRPNTFVFSATTTTRNDFSAPKIPNKSEIASPSHPYPPSDVGTEFQQTAPSDCPVPQTASGTTGKTRLPDDNAQPVQDHDALGPDTQVDQHFGCEDHGESREALIATPALEITEHQSIDTVPNGKDIDCTDTKACQDSRQDEKCGLENSSATAEADIRDRQQFGDARCISTVDKCDSDQATNDELSKMQQQALAAAESALQFDVDDLESESSADLLDDAQYLRNGAEVDGAPSIDADADAALIEFGLPKGDVGEEELVRGATHGGELPEDLDDLYPSDFLDAEVAPAEDSEDGEEAKLDM